MTRSLSQYTFRLLLTIVLAGCSVDAFSQQLVSSSFIGHTSAEEVNIWCMFKKADSVFLQIRQSGNILSEQRFLYQKEFSYKKYLPVNARFTGLQKNNTYQVYYSTDHRQYYHLQDVHTNNDAMKDFSFLAGSCAFIGTGFNRALKPFNSLKIFRYMQQDTADMMLWLGDNLYYVLQRQHYKAQLKRNVKTRLNGKLNAFLASKQQYAIWDDHDYGTNNSDGTFKYKSSSLNVFRQFWPNPVHDSFNYYTFRREDCDFFMLDDRFYNEHDSIVLGARQLQWLKDALAASDGTFKFICIGMQALNPLSTKECFAKTKEEYEALIEFISSQHITGVVFLSGDRHHGELMCVADKVGYPLYDFTTSPITMYPVKISSKSAEHENPYRIPQTYYPSYNYGKITVTGDDGQRKCVLELKNKAGNTVWTREISAAELK